LKDSKGRAGLKGMCVMQVDERDFFKTKFFTTKNYYLNRNDRKKPNKIRDARKGILRKQTIDIAMDRFCRHMINNFGILFKL